MPPTGPENHTGLYIHVPFCRARCRFCGFYFETNADGFMERLIEAELRELSRVPPNEATTAYIGGGSPTTLPLSLLARLIKAIYARQPQVRELTVECNPEQVTRDSLRTLRQLGVTRLSIGAQSFNDEELAGRGRTHRIALDLIFALPGSTEQTWQHTLDCARQLEPAHVSIYGLAIEPNTPLAAQIKSGKIKVLDEAQDRAQYQQGISALEEVGIKQYEISNFAREGYESRHNLGYWHNQPYIGIGPSASSYWRNRRTSNVASLTQYVRAIETDQSAVVESVSTDAASQACETAVLNLRTREGIHIKTFNKTTGYDIMRSFAEPIERYRALGLLTLEGDRLYLTREALPIADSVLCDFAAL
ncbi:MAG: radical SAM family heme chaperone HemW [Planctomycetes bacterium]|nr:radical SAM family heme chaperone HemW [Planctomycetota bacterium]